MLKQLVSVLQPGVFAAAVTLLVAFFIWPWQKFCVAVFRSKCVDLRSQLTKAAKAGRIENNNPIYKMLLLHLEFHSQSKHTISLSEVVAAHVVYRQSRKDIIPLDEAIKTVADDHLRDELMQIYDRSIEFQILQAAARSPALPILFAFTPAVILIAFRGTWARKARRFIVEGAKIADHIHTKIGHAPFDPATSR